MPTFAALAALLSFAPPASAQPDFYRGKTLSVVVGHEAGTGYDVFGRTLARHIGKHIPGHPSVLPQNTPGAGGLQTANWLNAVAPRDGLAVSVVGPEAAFNPLYCD